MHLVSGHEAEFPLLLMVPLHLLPVPAELLTSLLTSATATRERAQDGKNMRIPSRQAAQRR